MRKQYSKSAVFVFFYSNLTYYGAGVYEKYGDFDVDCFASSSNSKGKCFYSRCDVPGSSGMNFFHQR